MFGRLCRGVLTHTLTGTLTSLYICVSLATFALNHPRLLFNCPSDIGLLTTRNIFSGDVEGELCEETGVDIVGALDIIGEVNFLPDFL